MAERVNKDNFNEKVVESSLPVLVDFYSDSCIPCKKMSPIVGDIEDDYEGKLNVYKLNINFDSDLAEKYEVMSAPTFIIFKDGNELDRKTGAQKKTEILEWINQYI